MEHEEIKEEESIRITDIEKAEAKKEVENLATNAEDEEGDSDPEIRELEGECLKFTLRVLLECSGNALKRMLS